MTVSQPGLDRRYYRVIMSSSEEDRWLLRHLHFTTPRGLGRELDPMFFDSGHVLRLDRLRSLVFPIAVAGRPLRVQPRPVAATRRVRGPG